MNSACLIILMLDSFLTEKRTAKRKEGVCENPNPNECHVILSVSRLLDEHPVSILWLQNMPDTSDKYCYAVNRCRLLNMCNTQGKIRMLRSGMILVLPVHSRVQRELWLQSRPTLCGVRCHISIPTICLTTFGFSLVCGDHIHGAC